MFMLRKLFSCMWQCTVFWQEVRRYWHQGGAAVQIVSNCIYWEFCSKREMGTKWMRIQTPNAYLVIVVSVCLYNFTRSGRWVSVTRSTQTSFFTSSNLVSVHWPNVNISYWIMSVTVGIQMCVLMMMSQEYYLNRKKSYGWCSEIKSCL